MAVDVTSALELRYGLAPTWWIWRAGRDIAWNRAASEEPDVNVSTCPFNRVYATADVVEAGTIRLRILVLDTTTSVAALARGVDVAVRRAESASKAAIISDGTIVGGMQGHGVVALVIDTFDDIDFAFVGPIRAN